MTASARGLFRATGKKGKPIGQTSGVDLGGEFEHEELLAREADDFYRTPPEPIRALLAAELPRLRALGLLWEPAAGDGAIVEEIAALGLPIHGSDMIDRDAGFEVKNFYDFRDAPAKAILTNPPFNECNRDPGWIRHALVQLKVEYMALLLPVNWFGAAGRAFLWAQFPPARVYIMRWRVDFTGQGAPPMLNCWVIWDQDHSGEPILRMLDRSDARQAELFG